METNSFLAKGDFCHLLITFENSLGTDQNQPNIGSDLSLIVFLKEIFYFFLTTKTWKITHHAKS